MKLLAKIFERTRPPAEGPSVVHCSPPTLPEGEEDDRLDHEELEHRVVRNEQLARGEVEEEERVQRQADRDVVDDGDVQVAARHAGRGKEDGLKKNKKIKRMFSCVALGKTKKCVNYTQSVEVTTQEFM